MSTQENIRNASTVHGRALPDSHRPIQGLRRRLADAAARAGATLFGVIRPGMNMPMPCPPVFSPHTDSRRFACIHYGIMLPDLPAPHQFLSFASILGMPGITIADVDHAVSEHGPLDTAVVTIGTAVSSQNTFSSYSMHKDMERAADGSLIRFGQDATLSGTYPDFRLQSQRPDFSADLRLTATGDITWFGHSPIYQHCSLLVRYEGHIVCNGETTPVAGMGTWEYWRSISLYSARNRLLPPQRKLPGDFFTYQVINLDTDSQLLLAYVTLLDRPLVLSAYLRQAGQGNQCLDADVRFQVLTAQTAPAVAPDGTLMTLPDTFRWTVTAPSGRIMFKLDCQVDTPMIYGLANGYVGGYHWTGTREGQPVSGRGYIEYIDMRN